MNFSSSAQGLPEWRAPISPFDYRDVAAVMSAMEDSVLEREAAVEVQPQSPPGVSLAELEASLCKARSEASQEATETARREYEARLAEERATIRVSLEEFAKQRKGYFGGAEAEVIKLALAIAAKILHRESSADPLLVGALVRIALEKLQAGSSVTVRVAADEVEGWTGQLRHLAHGIEAEVVGDPHLGRGECVVQADVGSAALGIDAQLKEVEQNFFDLLAQRPTTR